MWTSGGHPGLQPSGATHPRERVSERAIFDMIDCPSVQLHNCRPLRLVVTEHIPFGFESRVRAVLVWAKQDRGLYVTGLTFILRKAPGLVSFLIPVCNGLRAFS